MGTYLSLQSCHRRCGNATMTFRETMENLPFVEHVLHDDKMNAWLIFICRFRDVITAHHCIHLWHFTAPREPQLIAAALVSACVYTGLAAACFWGGSAWLKIVFCELALRGGRKKTKKYILFGHISLLNSINTGNTPFKLYLECHRFCHCNFLIRRTHTRNRLPDEKM